MATQIEKFKIPFEKGDNSNKVFRVIKFLYALFVKPTFRVKQKPSIKTVGYQRKNKFIFKITLDLDSIHVKDRDDLERFINKLRT